MYTLKLHVHIIQLHVTPHLTPTQAANNRDSLAKLLYAELFEWLRGNINHELARDGEPVEGKPLTLLLLDTLNPQP